MLLAERFVLGAAIRREGRVTQVNNFSSRAKHVEADLCARLPGSRQQPHQARSGTQQRENQLHGRSIFSTIFERSTGYEHHCTVVLVTTDLPKHRFVSMHFSSIFEVKKP